MDNTSLVTEWATQSKRHGRNSQGSLIHADYTIYSYGTHYPLAKIYPKADMVLLNSTGYSKTTSRHASLVYRIVKRPTLYVPKVIVSTQDDHHTNLRYLTERLVCTAERIKRQRIHKYETVLALGRVQSNIALYRTFMEAYPCNTQL